MYIPDSTISRYGEDVPDELKQVSVAVLVASVTGFIFGGLIGARHAGDKYILMNHSTKYASPMQAQVSIQDVPY